MESKSRRSESGAASTSGHQPVRTVVGFHVEGAPRSHEERGMLATDQLAASPSPVIIPTTFPVRSHMHLYRFPGRHMHCMVGFHVKGAPRSHEERGMLATNQLAASPSPVIIPTTFPVSALMPCLMPGMHACTQ